MNVKQEKSPRRSGPTTITADVISPNGGMKILNDDRVAAPLPVQAMTSVPLAPTKKISMTLAKGKGSSAATTSSPSPTKKKQQMDHYVLKTIKGEADDEGGTDSDTIDFVLTDNIEGQQGEGLGGPSGEITEELHLTGDEEGGDEQTEEIVEHVCGKCYKSFRRFSGLKKHLDFCRFDSGYHLRKAEMMKNLEKIEKDAVIMENKDICFCCGESYDTFHLGHINCPDCPKSFKSQMSYERHIFITHSESNEHPCTICNAKLRSANLLKLHEEQHQNRGKPFACKICGKDFTRSYHLKRHQKYSSCSANENDSMNCKVCNKVFFRLDNLRAHLKQHLGTHVAKKPEYMCPICKNCFYSLSTLNIHTRTHTGERPFDCDLCDKKFPSLVALKKHRRYHTGEKPYTCSVCNQSFAVKEVLNRHMKRHTGERPHVCEECGKSFIQATQLRCHAKTHLRPYPCTECKEKFKTERQLERHAKSHNNKVRRRRNAEFSCTKCKTTYPNQEELDDHNEKGIHTAPPERKRRKARTDCTVCNKNFDSVRSLEFHILKAHGEVHPDDLLPAREGEETTVVLPAKIYKMEKDNNSEIHLVPKDTSKTNRGPDDDEPLAKRKRKSKQRLEDEDDQNAEITTGDEGDGSVVVQEFIIDEMPEAHIKDISMENESFTVIPLESAEGDVIEAVTAHSVAVQISPVAGKDNKKDMRKSLAESLAAAIADDDDGAGEENVDEQGILEEADLKLKENVGKLLDMLVDSATLKKFGWPQVAEETVLCKVIENCGHDLSKDSEAYKDCDYATRMREFVKLLFTVVIHNDSIKELLNNYPIDEVIEYVLGNEDDDDDDEGADDDGNSGVVTTKNDDNLADEEPELKFNLNKDIQNKHVSKLATKVATIAADSASI